MELWACTRAWVRHRGARRYRKHSPARQGFSPVIGRLPCTSLLPGWLGPTFRRSDFVFLTSPQERRRLRVRGPHGRTTGVVALTAQLRGVQCRCRAAMGAARVLWGHLGAASRTRCSCAVLKDGEAVTRLRWRGLGGCGHLCRAAQNEHEDNGEGRW